MFFLNSDIKSHAFKEIFQTHRVYGIRFSMITISMKLRDIFTLLSCQIICAQTNIAGLKKQICSVHLYFLMSFAYRDFSFS